MAEFQYKMIGPDGKEKKGHMTAKSKEAANSL